VTRRAQTITDAIIGADDLGDLGTGGGMWQFSGPLVSHNLVQLRPGGR
jgi:hypothetical protein